MKTIVYNVPVGNPASISSLACTHAREKEVRSKNIKTAYIHIYHIHVHTHANKPTHTCRTASLTNTRIYMKYTELGFLQDKVAVNHACNVL